MSYILDALRRADSERERGAVPSLHSKQVPAGLSEADDEEASGRSLRPLWWAVGALSLVLVVVVAWALMAQTAPEPERVAVAAPTVSPPPAAVQSPPVTAADTAVTPAAPVAAPAPLATQPTMERQSPPPARVAPAAAPTPAPAAARVAAAAKPAKSPDKPAVSPSRDEDAVVPSISELPDDMRRQLPSLSVSGASYSKNPSSRMLILNGQVFKEGDKVANDLVLEQIRLKSAVLSFRGKRYSINF